jgi:hypothetical protein
MFCALTGALFFLAYYWRRADYDALKELGRAGLIVCVADLIVELTGTYTGAWTYHASHLFVFKTVPAELPILFASSGVWLGALHLWIKRSSLSLSLDKTLLCLTALCLALCGLSYLSEQPLRMIVFTLPFGLWGFHQLKEDRRRALSVSVAALCAIADWVIETWAVGSGGYEYQEGFTVETPLTYALLTLGFMGILEALDDRRAARSSSAPLEAAADKEEAKEETGAP